KGTYVIQLWLDVDPGGRCARSRRRIRRSARMCPLAVFGRPPHAPIPWKRRLVVAAPCGRKWMMGTIVLCILVIPAVLAVTSYTRLIDLRNRYKNAFSQIDVQLKRRYDLIPNLVETAKGYLRHERQTLEAVIAARNQASSAAQRAAAAPGDATAMRDLA